MILVMCLCTSMYVPVCFHIVHEYIIDSYIAIIRNKKQYTSPSIITLFAMEIEDIPDILYYYWNLDVK